MESQENIWERILTIERERQQEITALCEKLIAAVPKEFPVALLESMGGKLSSLACGEMSFDRWIKAFVVHGSCEVVLGSFQLKGYLSKLDPSWRTMRDVEFAFDCLGFAWKSWIDMYTEIERFQRTRREWHTLLHIYFTRR